KVCRLMNPPEARTRKQSDLLPLAQIKLRACGKSVRRRFERHIQLAWKRHRRICRIGCGQRRRVNSFAPINRSRAADDAVAQGTEISAQGQPRSTVTPKSTSKPYSVR